jgi:hypothetical protein
LKFYACIHLKKFKRLFCFGAGISGSLANMG